MRSCIRVLPLVAAGLSFALFACLPKEDTFDPDDFPSSSSSGGSSGTSSSGGSSGTASSSSSGSTTSAGSISIRYTVTPSTCLDELPITNLEDDNDAVAKPAEVDVEYDGAKAGTYHGTIDIGSSGHGTFNYTLQQPAAGMHRQYLMNLIRFDQKLNHCVVSAVESTALKYTDVPEADYSSSSSGSSGSTAGGPIYLSLTVTSPCTVKDVTTSIPGVSKAVPGGTYGPIPAGTWNGSFYWYDAASGPNQTFDFGFTVKAPPAGTKRTVRIKLVDYATSLNHCVYGANSPVFDDQPLN